MHRHMFFSEIDCSTVKYISPASCIEPKFSLEQIAFRNITSFVFSRCLRGGIEGISEFLGCLPLKQKVDLLEDLHFQPTKLTTEKFLDGRVLTRSEYLRAIVNAWRAIYCSRFPALSVPNVQGFLLSRDDIVSGGNERNENFIRATDQMLSEAYAFILRHVKTVGVNAVKTVHLSCYYQRAVGTMSEKALVFSLIENFRDVRVLDLGLGCDDSILREVGRMCRHVHALTFAGIHVTDSGIRYLCGYLDLPIVVSEKHEVSDICKVLKYLDVSNAIQITPTGIRTILCNFTSLERLKCQDTYFLRILAEITKDSKFDDFRLPLTYFEYGISNSQTTTLLPSAAKFFPKLEELVLWNFDSSLETAFSTFSGWPGFKYLTQLKLNNLHYLDLIRILRQIGPQIQVLEMDNFGLDPPSQRWDSRFAKVDMYELSKLAPNLLSLSLVTCHVWMSLDKAYLHHLQILHVKGIFLENKRVLDVLLRSAPNIKKFIFFSLIDHVHCKRINNRRFNHDILLQILQTNPMPRLEYFIVLALDHAAGPIDLNEASVIMLIDKCPKLRGIGNLHHWKISDLNSLLAVLKRDYTWYQTTFDRSYLKYDL